MIVVAVATITLGSTTEIRRRAEFRRRAAAFSAEAGRVFFGMIQPALTDPMLREYDRCGEYFSHLAEKYEQAARYPWLPTAADPPLTDWPDGNVGSHLDRRFGQEPPPTSMPIPEESGEN